MVEEMVAGRGDLVGPATGGRRRGRSQNGTSSSQASGPSHQVHCGPFALAGSTLTAPAPRPTRWSVTKETAADYESDDQNQTKTGTETSQTFTRTRTTNGTRARLAEQTTAGAHAPSLAHTRLALPASQSRASPRSPCTLSYSSYWRTESTGGLLNTKQPLSKATKEA